MYSVCTSLLEANEFSSFIIIIEINLHRLIASINLRCLLFNEQKKLRENHKLSQSTDLGVCELEHSLVRVLQILVYVSWSIVHVKKYSLLAIQACWIAKKAVWLILQQYSIVGLYIKTHFTNFHRTRLSEKILPQPTSHDH